MQNQDFSEIVRLIRKEDGRYDAQAYEFVRVGLDHTVKAIKAKGSAGGLRHVTGKELSEGLRDYSLDQFGPMAMTVLREWGLTKTRDFGEIVYNLIEYNVFSKTESDRQEDFDDIYDFSVVFERPFLPTKQRVRKGSAAVSQAPCEAPVDQVQE